MQEHTPKRVVPVTVDVTTLPDGNVVITCSPNPVPIDKGASNVLLNFTLATPGYRFAMTKAITLDVPFDDFPFASWTTSDVTAALYDRNKVADELKYTVNVVSVKTEQEYSVDPVIQNGGGGSGMPDC
ncbi:MAG: hypothetical protein ABIR54_17170 [Burkholderiaceae bacterium]|jgi:hypothetical protein